jgi:ABC-type arginine transport system permease subunit
MIDKLKREWKTFSLAVIAIAIGTWEAAIASGYDLTPLVPEKWRPYALPGVGLFFLILRQWRDYNRPKDQ